MGCLCMCRHCALRVGVRRLGFAPLRHGTTCVHACVHRRGRDSSPPHTATHHCLHRPICVFLPLQVACTTLIQGGQQLPAGPLSRPPRPLDFSRAGACRLPTRLHQDPIAQPRPDCPVTAVVMRPLQPRATACPLQCAGRLQISRNQTWPVKPRHHSITPATAFFSGRRLRSTGAAPWGLGVR